MSGVEYGVVLEHEMPVYDDCVMYKSGIPLKRDYEMYSHDESASLFGEEKKPVSATSTILSFSVSSFVALRCATLFMEPGRMRKYAGIS